MMVYLPNLGDRFHSVKEHTSGDQGDLVSNLQALSYARCVTSKSISPMSLFPYLIVIFSP